MTKRLAIDMNNEVSVKRQRSEAEHAKFDFDSGDEADYILDSQVTHGERTTDGSQEELTTTSNLETLPFDILVEIASKLSPADLLNLARTSRPLRAILMVKSSNSIWCAARRNMGIPDGPDDLSEPLFAEILFGETCFLCQGDGTKRVLEQKLRLCRKCYSPRSDKAILCEDYIDEHYVNERIIPAYDSLFPVTTLLFDPKVKGDYEAVCWDAVAIQRILDEYLSYPSGSTERKEFVKTRKEYVDRVEDHVVQIDDWCRDRMYDNRDEIDSRLKALGYDDNDLDGCGDNEDEEYEWEALVRDYRPLTPKRWQKILPKFIDLIHNRRETQERREIADWKFNGDQDEAEEYLIQQENDYGYCYEVNYFDSDEEYFFW